MTSFAAKAGGLFPLEGVGAGTRLRTHHRHGAHFRRVIDLANVVKTMATNAPGEAAQLGSPYYGN